MKTPEEVYMEICENEGVKYTSAREKTRVGKIPQTCHIACYVLKFLFDDMSLNEIGKVIKRIAYDHSSVFYAIKTVNDNTLKGKDLPLLAKAKKYIDKFKSDLPDLKEQLISIIENNTAEEAANLIIQII